MGVACRIHRDKVNNNIISVDASNGKESILYKKAFEYFNDEKEALKIYALGNSDDFKFFNSDDFGNETYIKDLNGEPILKEVIDYLKITEKNIINIDNKIDFDNFYEGFNNSEDSFKSLLFNTFTDEFGNFEINKDKIIKSNLYTTEEIDNILNNEEIQNSIKNNIYSLDKFSSSNEDNLNLKITTDNKFDSFGKKVLYNEENLLSLILNNTVDISSEDEFENKLREIVPENIFNAIYDNKELYDSLLNISLESKKVIIKEFKNGELINKKEKDTFNTLKNSLLMNVNEDLLKNLNILSNLSYDVILNNYNDIEKLLLQVEKLAINSNIDIIGLKDNYLNSDVEKSHSFIRALNSFTKSIYEGIINDNVLKTYSEIYDDFFNVKQSFKIVNIDFLDSNEIVYVENLDELNAYRNNLLHIKDNYFIKIDNFEKDELKNNIIELYRNGNNVFKNIPDNIKSDSLLNQYIESIVNDKLNTIKEKLTSDNINDYKNIILLKQLYDSQDIIINKNNKIDSDFLSDLQNFILKEKLNNSNLYNKIYQYLSIEDNEIHIKNKEQIIKNRINNLLGNSVFNNKLKSYFLNKEQNEREISFNNKDNIDYINDEYEKQGNIITTTVDKDYIKEDQDIYEKIDNQNGISVYSKLIKTKDGIKLSEINKEFENIERDNLYKIQNHYTEKEKENILEEINNCN